MGLLDYTRARELYQDDGFMLQVIDALEDMDEYHLLRETSRTVSFPDGIPDSAKEYRRWLGICDGGLLFSTTLLSIEEYDSQLDLSFSTLNEWNTSQRRHELRLPSAYYIVGVLNYGDPVCVSLTDERVYLWNTEEEHITMVWDSFADFLADEYNTAVQMEEDGVLQPIPIKVG